MAFEDMFPVKIYANAEGTSLRVVTGLVTFKFLRREGIWSLPTVTVSAEGPASPPGSLKGWRPMSNWPDSLDELMRDKLFSSAVRQLDLAAREYV